MSRTVSLLVIALLLTGSVVNAQTSSCLAAPSGIVGWWPAEGTAQDIAFSSNGTLRAGASFAPGLVGSAFSFDGRSNTGIDIPANANISPARITLEAWVKPTAFGNAFPSVIRKNAGTTAASYVLALTNGAQSNCTVGNNGIVGGNVPLNTWSHVACTYDLQTLRLFVNGVEVASQVQTTAIPYASNALVIGGTDFPTREFTGLIDEPAIYNRALSAAELSMIYAAGANGKCHLDTCSSGLAAVQAQLAIANSQINQLSSQLAAANAQITDLTTRVADRDRQIQDLNTQLTTANGKITDLMAQLGQRDAQIADLTEQLTTATNRIKELTQQVADRDAQIADLNSQLRNASTRIAELTQQVADRDAQISSLKSDLSAATANIASLKQQLEASNAQVTDLKGQIASLNTQLQAANAANAQLKLDLQNAQATIASRDTTITNLQSQIVVLQQKLNDMQPASDRLIATLLGSDPDLSVITVVANFLSDAIRAASSQYGASDKRVVKAQKFFSDATADIHDGRFNHALLSMQSAWKALKEN